MPRKPKPKTIRLIVEVKGKPIRVSLYPPKPPRTSWFAYWPGLRAAKTTGQATVADAQKAAIDMLQNKGRFARPTDLTLTDEEFVEIQRRHFAKKTGRAAQERAAKSLRSCLEAIEAFRDIAQVEPVASATADDCEVFQTTALALPKDWLTRHDRNSKAEAYSPNTITKWSRELQAAFERANKNAGKKCVRSVAEPDRLLTSNPWHEFGWIEDAERPIRQFDDEELLALLHYFESRWPGATFATALARTFLWSWGRKEEICGLRWDCCRTVGPEVHFETVGKWGVEKWFRIPDGLYAELVQLRTESPYVFSAYNLQLREFHSRHQPTDADLVSAEFSVTNLGRWFDRRLRAWSSKLPAGRATIHTFRKTALKYARRGADLDAEVAHDARLGTGVMMRSYHKRSDPERRAASNRTFYRIAASLTPKTAARYGHQLARVPAVDIEEALLAAAAAKDWPKVAQLSAELSQRGS